MDAVHGNIDVVPRPGHASGLYEADVSPWLLGVILGLLSPVTIPITYARYTAVALLAALDSIFGALKAYIAGTFEPRVFFSGLITNMTLAGGLTYFGDKLGVDLSIAAIVAFGVRIFNNLGAIRRHYL